MQVVSAIKFASFFVALVPIFAGEPEIKDLIRVDANVYRGRQPGDESFATLAQMGVKTVIDLRGGSIHAPREKKLVEKAGMRYVVEGVSGIFPPRDEQIARLLAVMRDPAAVPVFVHCKRGADRSGVLIACYRMVRYGWTNQQALDEARADRFSSLEVLMRRYIRRFDPARLNIPVDAPAVAADGHLLLM